MKIASNDNRSCLLLEKIEYENGYSSISVEANIDLTHSSFQGANTDIHFQGIEDFVAKLDAFVMDRSIQPRLEGTYDSFIKLKGISNRVVLSFNVGSAFCGTDTFNYGVQGSFEVDQGDLNEIVSGFKRLVD